MTQTVDEAEAQLVEDIAGFTHDPLGYVLYAYPWGEKGSELELEAGPRQWQRDLLEEVGAKLKQGAGLKQAMEPVLAATASGHGIGKSACVSWIIDWAMSTHEDCKVVVTANTENQLRTKTWPEVAKWHRLMINSHWFTCTATAMFSRDPAHEKTWRADAIPWSENNTEAFAGLHNAGKRVVLIFDEGSAIADRVWEVAEGALTDEGTEILWFTFGNPTRNTGRFRECFGRLAHRWSNRQIDSRTVEGTNKGQLAKWVEDYGEDSDFVRVRVRGMFPMAGDTQFISSTLIDQAIKGQPIAGFREPLIMAVDISRKGGDQNVARFRRGTDARTIKADKWRNPDLMWTVGHIGELINRWKPDGVFIDETGLGAGVVDRLRQLGFNVTGVNFASKADGTAGLDNCANKRAEMWCRMREWLRTGGCIDADKELRDDLEGIEYGYDAHNRILLEKKEDMAKRGLASPDNGDALAMTFAYPVGIANRGHTAQFEAQSMSMMAITEYDPYK
jgi:hypothetical protein